MKNVFISKRWIALFLALLLIVTTCVSSTDAFLWASPEDEASKEINMPLEETKEISFDDDGEESLENESYVSIETETGDENEGDSDDNDSTGTETDIENNGSDEGDGLDEGDEVTDPDETLSSENSDETLGSDDETGDENITYSYVIKYYFYDEEIDLAEEGETLKGTGEKGTKIPVEDSEGDIKEHNGLQYVFDHIEGSETIIETEDDNIVKVYYKLKTEETGKEEETEGNDQESELNESVKRFVEAMEELPEADEINWEEAGTVYGQLISDEMSEGYREAREFLGSQENQEDNENNEDNEVKKACDKYEALLETTKNMRNIKLFVDTVEEVPARDDITLKNAREVHDLLNRDEVSDGYRQALGVREKFTELWEFCDKYASVLDAASTILGYNESELHLDSNLSFEDLQDRINNANRPLTILPGDSSYTFTGTLTIPAGKTVTIQGIAVSGTVNGPLIEIGGGGCLILSESASLNGNVNGGKGGGAYVGGGGIFRLEGGTISGCGAGLGGGVFVDTNGTFNFTSGTIEGCSAKFGGGAYVNGGGHFNFNGGTISGCSAEVGGGVYLELNAVFERSGGEIKNCTATVSDNDIYDAKDYTGDNKDKLVGQTVQIAIIRDASCIPNEPSVSTQKYLFLRDSYEGDYGYPVFAPNAAGYINRDILNDPNYKYAVGAEGVSYSGKQYLKDIDWDKVLAAVANWNENEGQNEEWTVHAEDGEKLTKGNMDEYEIYPYVVKLEGSGWHIDCVVVPKNRIKLLYQLNLGQLVDNVAGFVAPAGNTYSPKASVTVGKVQYYGTDVNIGDPINVTKDGKEATLYFAGWSTSIDGTAAIYKPGDIIQINGDTTLYGVWRTEYKTHDISYRVEYYKNGVKADEEIIKDSVLSDVNSLRVKPIDENKYEDENFEFDHYEVDDEKMELPETVKNGAVIKVYYVSKEATYIVKHLYQNIEDNEYTENEDHRETLFGAIGTQTAAQARTEAGFIAQEVVQKTILANELTVVEIRYDRQSYEVSYSYGQEVPDGVQDAPEKATKAYNTLVDVDTTYQAGDTVEDARGVWTFSGWSTEDATVVDGKFEMPANNVAFTGNWTLTTAAEYEVSYSYGEDVPTTATSAPATEKKEYNTTVNVDTTYKAGDKVTDARGEWTFSGWSTEDATVKNGSFDMPAKDVAFTGSWELTTAAEYEVSYSYSGTTPDTAKTAPGTEKKKYNTSVDVDTTYKAGDKVTDARGVWTFKGWSTGDATVENGSFHMPAKNVAFTGSWELTGRESYDILYTYVGDVPETASEAPQNVKGAYGLEAYVDTTYVVNSTVTDARGIWTFSGWSTEDVTVTNGKFEMPANNVTFTGSWTLTTAAEYEVSYSYSGEVPDKAKDAPAKATKAYNTPVDVDTTYVAGDTVTDARGVWTFSGWSTTDATVAGGSFNMPANNVAFTGSWELTTAAEYEVSYSYSGDVPDKAKDAPAKAVKAYNTPVDVDTTYVAGSTVEDARGVWTFSGWSTTDATVENGSFEMPANNVAFTGNWTLTTAAEYKVSYSYGEDVPTTAKLAPTVSDHAYGTSVSVDTTYQAEDTVEDARGVWTFSGWSTEDATVKNGSFDMPAKNVAFTGSWTLTTAAEYEVSYSYSGATPDTAKTAPGTEKKKYNTSVDVDTTYKAGDKETDARGVWTFKGWSTGDATVENGSFDMPAKNVAFTGSWELTGRKSYDILYTYVGDVPTTASAAPQNVKGTYGLEAYVDTTYVVNSTVTDARGIWTFSGWSTEDVTVADGKFEMPANNVTFTGSWTLTTAAEYEVSYSYSGDVPDKVKDAPAKAVKAYNTPVDVDTTYVAGDTVTDARGVWTFSGWSTKDATVAGGSFNMPANNVAFTGSWELTTAAEYEVSYSYSGDVPDKAKDAPAKAVKAYNTPVDVDTTYAAGSTVTDARGVWTFSGWSTKDATVENGSFEMPAKNVAFTGNWTLTTAAEYAVSYSYSGEVPDGAASAPTASDHAYGTSVSVDTTYTGTSTVTDARGEWMFSGWSTADAAVENGSFEMPAKNVAFTGSWSLTDPAEYEVSYSYGGTAPDTAKSAPEMEKKKYNTPVDVDTTYKAGDKETDTRGEWTFKGWSTTDVAVEEDGSFNMPAKNVAFTGSWELTGRKSYDILYTYVGDVPTTASAAPKDVKGTYGLEAYVDTTYEVNSTATDARGIWTFSGWSTEDVTVTNGKFEMPANNVTFTGSWTLTTAAEYEVSYSYSGDVPDGAASVPTEAMKAYGTPLTVDKTYEKGSNVTDIRGTWTFSGWSTTDTVLEEDGSFTMPPNDVKFEGTWSLTASAVHQISVTVNSATEDYNGQEHVVEGFVDQMPDGRIPVVYEGKTYYVSNLTAYASGKNVTDSTSIDGNGIPVVTDESGRDLSAYFNVAINPGKLTINPIPITITAGDATGKYTGRPLTVEDTNIQVEGMIDGQSCEAKISGSQTLVGESESNIVPGTVVIMDGNENVTGNYTITLMPGKITVTDEDENGPVEDELVITKTHTPKSGGFEYGDTVEFTISITNIFEESVTVTLKELEGVVFGDIENDDTISSKLKAAWKNAKSKISGSNERTFTIAAGETKEIRVYYTIDIGDIIAGEFTNYAVVTLNGKEYEAEDKVETKELSTKYSVDKVITDADPDKVYEVNDVIHYQITVTSEASIPLENVKVRDELINATGRVVFTGLDEMAGIKFDSKENTVTITTLAPYDVVTLNCEYTVTREDCFLNNKIEKTDPNGAGIKNKAKVTIDPVVDPDDPDDPKPVPGEETDPVGPSSVEKVYTLTIYYQYTNGGTAAPTVVREYLAGDGYTEYSPAISGYTWSAPFVTGKMPEGDLTLVVYYTAVVTPPTGGGDPDPDPDPTPVPTGTPGPSATPTPTPTSNTPPVIPVQPTPGGIIPVIIPVEPTVVAINDDPVPMGAIVDVDDDGNVTLTPITEDEIPLDNRELDDHKCCILSFLLMLLTLIIYTWFTHSMKKNQKKLEEMKDELAEETLKKQLGITDENTNKGKSAQA